MNFDNWFLTVFPVFFIGMWFFVLKMLSMMSGWAKLAEQFHCSGTFEGRLRRFQSARIRQVNFSGCLNIGVCEEGLYLVPAIFFHAFHKPLLIPWSEIVAEPFQKFLLKGHRVTIESFPSIPIEIYGKVFDDLLNQLKLELASLAQTCEIHTEGELNAGE